MSLKDYVTLGRSGLRVSPLCLGAMTFGTDWGWGADEATAQALLLRYVEAGGNFVDTANSYTNGTSEQMLGKFIAGHRLRDSLVLATKFTRSMAPGNPNAVGNGRKNIYLSLERSLRQLQTDYIDLYWLHSWDMVTPVQEVPGTLNDLVRAGKIRHYGLSDVPAWYATRAQTLAESWGLEPMVALQLEYSLVERSIEREHIPAAQELGIGICPWGPLASGLLSGKYRREAGGVRGDGRLGQGVTGTERFTARNWHIVDALLAVAEQLGKPPAQVAINWVASAPGITSPIVGATRVAQLDDSLAALEFTLPAELRARLDEASMPEIVHPYTYFGPPYTTRLGGGVSVRAWRPMPATSGRR